MFFRVQNLHKQKSSNNYSLDVLQASKIVSVTNEGVLKSFSVIGKCSLVITSLDLNSGLTENLIVLVEVKPIFYLVTKSVNSWSINTNDLVKHVPLGTELQFEVDYYDNIGKLIWVVHQIIIFKKNIIEKLLFFNFCNVIERYFFQCPI